jgi:hypothetical protein
MSPSGSRLGGSAGDAAAIEAALAVCAALLSTGCCRAVLFPTLLLLQLLLVASVNEAARTGFDALAAGFSVALYELLLAVRLSSRVNRNLSTSKFRSGVSSVSSVFSAVIAAAALAAAADVL